MFKVKFADIGEGLTEGKVTEVLVKIGDSVKMGDSLFHVETDKVDSEIPSPTDGKIAKILIKANQEIKVGDVVVEIDDGKVSTEEPLVQEEENASVVGSTPVSNDVIPSRGGQTKKPAAEVEKAKEIFSAKVEYGNNEIAPSLKDKIGKFEYDVIIVGAGVGGYTSAIKCAQLGLKTLIVEKDKYGGVCLNIGCIPTKTLLKSAYLYSQIKNKAAFYGIKISAESKVEVDWKQFQGRKDEVVAKLTKGVEMLVKKNLVAQVKGEAIAVDQHTIKVGDKKYTCESLVIATGSDANSLRLPGAEEAIKSGFLINSTGALSLKTVPKKMIIIGGGVIGVEFANLYSNIGVDVTILQAMPTILEILDNDVSVEMTKIFKKNGVTIKPNVKILEFKKDSVVYESTTSGEKITIKADVCLQSVGRHAITSGFEKIGIQLTERGFIQIDDYCQTNIKNVYAIGDVNGKVMLAHAASKQGIIVANHIAKKRAMPNDDHKMEFDKIPSCIYTHPEVATVGKTEQEVKASNIDYKAYKFPFSAIGKALADGNTEGFVKLIIEPEFGKILGAHIISSHATDMISEITTVMECEGTISEIAMAIHPHPTLSEAIGEAAEALLHGKPINF
ncbi:pyruvate dehydrogenase E3 component [Spiroplasma sp. TIUS-1]|uniref:dihydrolipoyl dehydrogenase n=1 Tax=Spiroplasma sp. TIUS-1 TaxID=216963 RepID=UPI00139701D1|nr:dihydrolipoyl dehydrogenase [Spiroplasma sp. TIUS-1]QHX35658.1 pyruvate dehydrogenase E3 component [Spiroplasma sp. TIUS-1]